MKLFIHLIGWRWLLAMTGGMAWAASLAQATTATTLTNLADTKTGSALDRPALASAHGSRSVLLGAAMAGSSIVAVGERGLILLSDDHGKSWQQSKVPVSVTLTAVRFVDPFTGWATGHGGTVLATRDGGKTWQRQLDGFAAAKALLADAQQRGDPKALKEAERLMVDGADKPFLDLHFFDARRGLVVGAYSLAFSTDDGGKTWQPLSPRLDNPMGLHLYVVRARGKTVLLAGEQGLVLKSDDGGMSFRRVTTPYGGSFFTAELPHDGSVWLAGLRGNVWRSDDSGAQWTALSGAGPTTITASTLATDGALWLVNQAGQVLRGAGTALLSQGLTLGAPATGVLKMPDGQLLVLTLRGARVHAVPRTQAVTQSSTLKP